MSTPLSHQQTSQTAPYPPLPPSVSMPSRAIIAPYEVSLRAHQDPQIGKRLRPSYAPFWVEPREISRYGSLSYIFYEDSVRGTLLHSRELKNQAFPSSRDDGPGLDPSRCRGVWYWPAPNLAKQLKQVEADMVAAFEEIKAGKLQGNVMPLAGYLRQLFDHFLHVLAKTPPANPKQGGFGCPIPLTSVQEPHMKNALANRARGRSYKVGAWLADSSNAPSDESSQSPKQKRAREPHSQAIREPHSRSSGGNLSEGVLEQNAIRKPKRLRLITTSRSSESRTPSLPAETSSSSGSDRPDEPSTPSIESLSSEKHGCGGTEEGTVELVDNAGGRMDDSEDVGAWELLYSTALPSHTSMQANSGVLEIEPNTTAKLVDVPGHPRIRGTFTEYMKDAKAVVFVVDVNSIARNGASVAEHLHQVLHSIASLPPSQATPPLLIHAHKSDLLVVRTNTPSSSVSTKSQTRQLAIDRTRTILERELEKRRKAAQAGVNVEGMGAVVGSGAGEEAWDGVSGLECSGSKGGNAGTFKFEDWDGGDVSFSAGWVDVIRDDGIIQVENEKRKADAESEDDGLAPLREWIASLP
ncbi:hypothetical protein FRB90_009852 [Tulasnella sp. 427]|nr:hypothetical protein FRB90_009852 [Tulasnella sp. 427]